MRWMSIPGLSSQRFLLPVCADQRRQMLSYEKQLDLKRDVVVKAYANYFGTVCFTIDHFLS
jgi:hypothetical protein